MALESIPNNTDQLNVCGRVRRRGKKAMKRGRLRLGGGSYGGYKPSNTRVWRRKPGQTTTRLLRGESWSDLRALEMLETGFLTQDSYWAREEKDARLFVTMITLGQRAFVKKLPGHRKLTSHYS